MNVDKDNGRKQLKICTLFRDILLMSVSYALTYLPKDDGRFGAINSIVGSSSLGILFPKLFLPAVRKKLF